MATGPTIMQADASSSKSRDQDRERSMENAKDKSFSRTVETEPKQRSWMIVAAGAVVPLGLSAAAAVTTYVTAYERVAVTAWIAVAIVGTASVVSTAAAARRRNAYVQRDDQRVRAIDQSNGFTRAKSDSP